MCVHTRVFEFKYTHTTRNVNLFESLRKHNRFSIILKCLPRFTLTMTTTYGQKAFASRRRLIHLNTSVIIFYMCGGGHNSIFTARIIVHKTHSIVYTNFANLLFFVIIRPYICTSIGGLDGGVIWQKRTRSSLLKYLLINGQGISRALALRSQFTLRILIRPMWRGETSGSRKSRTPTRTALIAKL